MTSKPDRHPQNVPGDWYVDQHCIDCGASISVAPGLIARQGGQAVFVRQPADDADVEAAWRAALVCPTASVRRESRGSPPHDLYPQELAEGVYRCGYNARSSYGAHSYFIERPAGNVMIDAPRWTRRVTAFLDDHRGLDHIFLTHRDDVADAKRYAEAYGAQVWIHDRDGDAAPFATRRLRGDAEASPLYGWQAIPVPGHTEGSVLYLLENTFLFSGDSLAWSHTHQRLTAFRDACWYSWSEQARSLARLRDHEFQWVLAGHGASVTQATERMQIQLQALLDWMAT